MTGVHHAGSIRTVVSGRGVPRTFAFALVGRLTYGVLPLCFLFTVRQSSGSFAVAAAASAALGFATLAMPLQARLVDRFGQRRVLPWYAASYAAVLLTAALVATANPPDLVWVGTGLLLGLSGPALGPSMRAQWREIAAEGPARRAAYSLDSIAEESLYLVGPLLAGLLLATGPARLGLLVAGVLVLIGTAGLVTSAYVPGVEGAASDQPRSRSGLLRRPGLPALLATMAVLGTAGAACFVGVAATADRAGTPGAVGLVEAAMAVGAIVAGWAWSRLRVDPPWPRALAALLLVVLVGQVAAAASSPSLLLVGASLVVVGATTVPVLVVAFTGADALVPPEQRTEASTWVTTTLNGGSALGTALAGAVLGAGPATPFWCAAGLTALALAVVTVRGRRLPARPLAD